VQALGVGIVLTYLVPPTLLFLPLSRMVAQLGLQDRIWALVLSGARRTTATSTHDVLEAEAAVRAGRGRPVRTARELRAEVRDRPLHELQGRDGDVEALQLPELSRYDECRMDTVFSQI
jgi:hypothetical protein